MTEGITITNLFKEFKTKDGFVTAVDHISFSVHLGETVGLLGPNGAGKTTTLRMMLGVIIPDAGDIRLLGKDLFRQREEILKVINFTFVNATFGSRLTVEEVLRFFAYLYEVPESKKKISDLLERFEISHLKNKSCRELSSGELSRVALCKALVNSPKILFLDEPTASLDPDIADKTRILIKQIQKEWKMTILYTSHNMDEVEEMCERILFMHRGKIVVSGTPLEITKKLIEQRAKEPALDEVFLKITRGGNDELV